MTYTVTSRTNKTEWVIAYEGGDFEEAYATANLLCEHGAPVRWSDDQGGKYSAMTGNRK